MAGYPKLLAGISLGGYNSTLTLRQPVRQGVVQRSQTLVDEFDFLL